MILTEAPARPPVSPLQIQDVAEQGVMFVGFLQQPGGGPCFAGSWDPDDLSSLHSSPSPIHRQPYSVDGSPAEDAGSGGPLVPGESELAAAAAERRRRRSSGSDSCPSSPETNPRCERKTGPEETHNNNNDKSTPQARK